MTEAILRTLLRMRAPGIIWAGHGVAEEFTDRRVEAVHLRLREFTAVVETTARLGFEFVSMNDVLNMAHSGFRRSRRRPWAHFTFDDGYMNNLTVLSPYMRKMGIPFSVFVSTHYVASGDYLPTFHLRYAEKLGKDFQRLSFWRGDVTDLHHAVMFASIADYDRRLAEVKALFSPADREGLQHYRNDRPLDADALRALASDDLVHIGSHSHRHVIYHDGQDPAEMRAEIQTSLNHLDRWLGPGRPRTFCYPNGNFCAAAVDVLRELGFAAGLASGSGFPGADTDRLLLPRFWLANAGRTKAISALALLGNRSLPLFGRRAPRVA